VFYFLQVALSSLVFTIPPSQDVPGCYLIKQKTIFPVFVFIMVFETLILALTLIKGIQHFRGTKSTLVSVLYRDGIRNYIYARTTTLVSVLYRDGIMNYIYLCVLSIVNVSVLLTVPHGYTTLLTAFQRAIHSILSARILLHLREAAVIRSKNLAGPGLYLSSQLDGFTADRAQATVNGTMSNPGAARSSLHPVTVGMPCIVRDVAPVLPKIRAFSHTSAEPEFWFGESSEGVFPETVTWFGDQRDWCNDMLRP